MSIIRNGNPVELKKTSCRPVNFKKASCCCVEFKKVSCRMSLRTKKGHVAFKGPHPIMAKGHIVFLILPLPCYAI